MCLSTVGKKKTTKRTGRKAFWQHAGLFSPYQYNSDDKPYPIGEWIVDTSSMMILCSGVTYKSGFHVWLTLEGAESHKLFQHVIRKVRFRKVVATGTQDGCGVAVAREMLILEEEK